MQCLQAARSRGDNTQARVPGGRPVTAGRPRLSSALSPDTAMGKESCFEVKLLEHHLRNLMSVWRHQGARDEKPGQRLGALASQPAARTQEAPNSGAPKLRAAPQPPAALQTGALSKGRAQGAEAGGHCIYLMLLSFNIFAGVVFFFFFFNSLQTETVKS